VFQNSVPRKDVTNPVSLPSFYCIQNVSFLLDPTYYFIFLTIAQTDLLHPFPAPHFKTFKVFLYFTKCPSFSIKKVMFLMYYFTSLFLTFKYNLLMKNVFLLNAALPNPRFNSTLTTCTICYQATQTVEIIHILQFLLVTQPKPSPQTKSTNYLYRRHKNISSSVSNPLSLNHHYTGEWKYIKQDMQFMCNVTMRGVRVTILPWKSTITYLFWVCVCSLSYPVFYVMHMGHIVACGLSGSTIFFHVISS